MSRTMQARLLKLEAIRPRLDFPASIIVRRDDSHEVKAAAVALYRRMQHRRTEPLLICGKEDAETQRLLLESA